MRHTPGSTLLLALLALRCSPFGRELTPAADAGGAASASDSGAGDACAGIDLTRNAKHCGRCGRDCGAGDCLDGECAPHIVGCEPAAAPFYFAVDGESLFWTSRQGFGGDDGVHRRRLADPSGPSEKLGGTIVDVFAIAATADALFVSAGDDGDQAGVHMMQKDGTGVVRRFDRSSLEIAIARDGATVFHTSDGVGSFPVASGANLRLAESSDAEGLAVDSTHVYWTVRRPATEGGKVARVPLGGGAEETVLANVAHPRRLATDDEALYVVTSSDRVATPPRTGSILRRSADGIVARLLEAGTGRGGVVLDERYLYATLEDDGAVVRIDKRTGGARRDLATGLNRPVGIARDDRSIWFGEVGTGCIWRMTR